MLTIRFSKIGRKGERKYRIVVKEKRDKRDGKVVDIIGFYEKKDKNNIIKQINKDRINYWVSHGAQISESVKKIL